jgi:hypothetical protein
LIDVEPSIMSPTAAMFIGSRFFGVGSATVSVPLLVGSLLTTFGWQASMKNKAAAAMVSTEIFTLCVVIRSFCSKSDPVAPEPF